MVNKDYHYKVVCLLQKIFRQLLKKITYLTARPRLLAQSQGCITCCRQVVCSLLVLSVTWVLVVHFQGLFSGGCEHWQHGIWWCSKAVLSDDENARCCHSSHSTTPESHLMAVLCNVCISSSSVNSCCCYCCYTCFSALMLLVGWQEGHHLACTSSAAAIPKSLVLATGLTWSNLTWNNSGKLGRLNKSQMYVTVVMALVQW